MQNRARSSPSDLIPDLARQIAMERGASAAGGARIYRVSSPWVMQVLREDKRIPCVHNSRELQIAMEDKDCHTILIAGESTLTMGVISRLCMKSGQKKTVFYEETDI